MKTFRTLVILLYCALMLQGCPLAPAIDSLRESGFTQSSRVQLLPKDMKKFSDALQWGDPQAAMFYVTEEGQSGVGEALKELRGDVRVVESKVRDVKFDPDAYEADVTVAIKYYKVPYYVVTDLNQHQVWKFSHSSGWQLHSAQTLKG